ncbi:Acetyl-coenzyme A synthetase [Listeria monocytogenes]|nr:Acetyl-coenzyme A synthetase [Listeria monocytogenes]
MTVIKPFIKRNELYNTFEEYRGRYTGSFEIVTELKEKHFGGKTALYVELENDNYHTAQYILAKGRISLQWIESEQTKVVYDAKKTMVAMNKSI